MAETEGNSQYKAMRELQFVQKVRFNKNIQSMTKTLTKALNGTLGRDNKG